MSDQKKHVKQELFPNAENYTIIIDHYDDGSVTLTMHPDTFKAISQTWDADTMMRQIRAGVVADD